MQRSGAVRTVGHGLSAWLLGIGLAPAVLAIVSFSVLASVLITGVGMYVAMPEVRVEDWIYFAILAPALISPAVGFVIMSLAYRLKQSEETLARVSRTDTLTGIGNRRCFIECATRVLSAAERARAETAIFILDVDDFKKVNDTYGHAAGDDVLKYVAGVVSENSEATDVVARLGGDEFALMRKGCSADEAMQWAQKIAEAIGSPQARDRVVSDVKVSIGIALASDGSADTDQLMKNADLALYASKKRGKSYVSLYDETMEDALVAQEMMRSDLAVAVSNLAFSLQYQPLIDIATGEVTAFEALLRWQRRPGEMVSPAVFVPMLEESRDIIAVGEWVLRQACELAASLPTSISIAVNISARQFEPTLPLRVASALSRAGLPASRLQLEITESVLIAADDANLDILQQLRALGVRVALDDFGTRYSSLGYLHRFQFDKLKIDQSFVGQERNREQAHTIIRSIAQLGHSLGIRVTAEGIETPADLKEVQDAGCHEAQGYLFSRPIPADRIWSFIEERSGAGPGARQPQLTSAARAP
jgi:diguanylate cyclase (GGDEF)-like protein